MLHFIGRIGRYTGDSDMVVSEETEQARPLEREIDRGG